MTTLAEAIRAAIETSSDTPTPRSPMSNAIPTGISGLDHLLTPGTLTVIAGSFGHGADILATNIARVASIGHGVPTLFTSCRSGQQQVMEHLISAMAGVDIDHIAANRLSAEEKARIAQASGPIKAAPLYVNNEHRSITGIAREITATRARLAVIEGAHLLTDEESFKNEAHRADAQSLALMRLAVREDIPIVVSVPLRAGGRDRPLNAAPRLSDFGACRAYEASASVVILVHRPELNGEDHRAGEIDIVVAKRRNGSTSQMTARMQVQYDRIVGFPSAGAP